jgi:ABC-type nitrate/sulfonate/bicarbonate transport system ATPase subunit
MAAVELRGVAHAYRTREGRVPVLDGVSLAVQAGEFVSVVGPSGCGKSTLLRLLAGLDTPERGALLLGGAPPRPGRAAYLPQRDALLPWRRALDNAVLAAVVGGVDPTAAEQRARALLGPFGLAGFERAWPSQLSGGMRQRLALLRTFLSPAGALLLDEPFGALDAITRRRLQGWLEGVWLDDRRTVVLVTHDVEEALLLADRVVVLSPRPAAVVRVLSNPAGRPRAASSVTEPGFVARKAELLAVLDA